MEDSPRIAILIPCHNEQATVAKVVGDFRAQLPRAAVYVFDNNCTDDTAAIARRGGAVVLKECRQGKGYVIENMFDRVRADYYVMVDGDDTYAPESVHALLAPVLAGDADMAVGARLAQFQEKSFRPLHYAGNSMIRRTINLIFGAHLTDILSGYRAFNRRVAVRVPVVSQGFEVETELTIQMLYLGLKIVELQTPYRARPEGSRSKLNTFSDGARIVWKLFSLFRAFKPLTFFGGLGLVLLALGIAAGVPALLDYLREPNHFVRHVPLAILATGLVLLAGGSFLLGVLLHALNWRFKELHNIVARGRD